MNRLLKHFMAPALAPFALSPFDSAKHLKSAGIEAAIGWPFARLIFVQSHAGVRSRYEGQ